MIAVRHIDTDWGAQRLTFINTGYDSCCVALFTRCGNIALSWAATIEFELNLFN
jgi:hypothetical protein